MESELEKYKQRVKQRIERLLPAIAKVSIGDFSEEIEVPDEEDEFTELAAGLRMMTEDLEYHLTEFKRAEEERARVATVMATFEAIVDMVLVLDLDGKVVHANRAWLQIFGPEPKDVLGKDIVDMPGIEIQKPEFVEKLMASIGEATEKGRIGPMDLVVVTMDGSEVPMDVAGGVIRDAKSDPTHIVVVLRDITEHKRVEEALRESERLYRLLAENVTDVIWTIDMNLRFTYLSPSVIRMRGFSAEETMAQKLEEVITPASLRVAMNTFAEEPAKESMKQKDMGRSLTLELEFTRKGGSTVWTETKITFLSDPSGKPVGILGIARDITERRRAEEQVIRSEKLASVGTLASGVAHEINNPLAGIRGYAEAIVDEVDSTLMRSYARKIVDVAERASEVVRWLSRYSRQAKDVNIVDVDLNEISRDSLEAMRFSRLSANIEVKPNYGELPSVRGNRAELQQVFVNLLGNSVDAMPEGGRIVLSTRCRGGLVEVEVSDTGMGIPEEHMAKIFDPFFTTKEVGKGTGLGLYVISMIIKKHHGTIEVESEVGKGTAFILRFPAKERISEVRSDLQPKGQGD